jgi:hypothetical protein
MFSTKCIYNLRLPDIAFSLILSNKSNILLPKVSRTSNNSFMVPNFTSPLSNRTHYFSTRIHIKHTKTSNTLTDTRHTAQEENLLAQNNVQNMYVNTQLK